MLAKDIREMSEADINARIAEATREAGSGKRVTARRVTGRRGRKSAGATNRAKTSKRA